MAIVFQPLYQDDRGNHAELVIDDAALVCTGVRVTVAANVTPLRLSCTIGGVDYEIEYPVGETTTTPFPTAVPVVWTEPGAGVIDTPVSRRLITEAKYVAPSFTAVGHGGGKPL